MSRFMDRESDAKPLRRSGQRDDRWIVFAGIVLLVLTICGGGTFGVLIIGKSVQEFLHRSYLIAEPINQSIQLATHSPTVKQRLGEPVELHLMYGRLNNGPLNPKGDAYKFHVRGPKGEGVVEGLGVSPGNAQPYRLTKLTVTFADKTVVTLVPAPSSGEGQ